MGSEFESDQDLFFFKRKIFRFKKFFIPLFVCLCFVGLFARSKNLFFFAVSKFHCSFFKCLSFLKICPNRNFNIGCNFTNSICINLVFVFSLFFFLSLFLKLTERPLIASFDDRKRFCVRMCSDGKEDLTQFFSCKNFCYFFRLLKGFC